MDRSSPARHLLVGLALLVWMLAVSGCGGTDDYSEEEVIAAFAREEIALEEVIRPGDHPNEETLEVTLGPRIPGDRELSVNLFFSQRALDEYMMRSWGSRYEGCRRTETEMGCVQRNILVGLDLRSRRFDPQKIERALSNLE